jgi:hypothetical protein
MLPGQQPGSAQVIYRAMKKRLWDEMMEESIQSSSDKSVIHMGDSYQIAALSKLSKSVDSATSPISEPTAALLEQVWMEMLARVRYPEPDGTVGFDGTTYHVLHWARGIGFRSGTTWSPDDGSKTGALIEITESLKKFVLAQSKDRPGIESSIADKAKALLRRLKQETNIRQ